MTRLQTAGTHLRFTSRRSDSPRIDVVWTCTSEQVDERTSVAGTRCGLVFSEQDGRHRAVTGPETAAGTAPVPKEAVFVGIEFAIGTTLRGLPIASLVDGGVELPDTTARSFHLAGPGWEMPHPGDAEALVERLVRSGAAAREPIVAEVLHGGRTDLSERTLERRGLARALRRYVGRTATQLRSRRGGALALDLAQPTTSYSSFTTPLGSLCDSRGRRFCSSRSAALNGLLPAPGSTGKTSGW